METLIHVWVGISVIASLFVLIWLLVDSSSRLSRADRHSRELMRAVLSEEEYGQILQRGFIDIPSPTIAERVYRVPRARGLVRVIEKEKLKACLCLQTLEWVPDADLVVMHKLMIEADEATYLQTANKIVPVSGNGYLN